MILEQDGIRKPEIVERFELGEDVLFLVDGINAYHVFQKDHDKYLYLGIDAEENPIEFKVTSIDLCPDLEMVEKNELDIEEGLQLLNEYKKNTTDEAIAQKVLHTHFKGLDQATQDSLDIAIYKHLLLHHVLNQNYKQALIYAEAMSDGRGCDNSCNGRRTKKKVTARIPSKRFG